MVEETTTSNNKNRGEQDGDGHIFYPASSPLPLSADQGGSTRAQIGMMGGSQRGKSVKP